MVEKWLVIDAYPFYKISSQGRVINLKWDRLLNPHDTGSALVVGLRYKGTTSLRLVHRLVAEAFYGILDIRKFQVKHLDEDYTNNFVGNLDVVPVGQGRGLGFRHSALNPHRDI